MAAITRLCSVEFPACSCWQFASTGVSTVVTSPFPLQVIIASGLVLAQVEDRGLDFGFDAGANVPVIGEDVESESGDDDEVGGGENEVGDE